MFTQGANQTGSDHFRGNMAGNGSDPSAFIRLYILTGIKHLRSEGDADVEALLGGNNK